VGGGIGITARREYLLVLHFLRAAARQEKQACLCANLLISRHCSAIVTPAGGRRAMRVLPVAYIFNITGAR
jgi:predicted Fe-Mo cluster-binding NifX family protein